MKNRFMKCSPPRMILGFGFLVFLNLFIQVFPASQKEKKPAEQPGSSQRFKVAVDLVTVNATVTDRQKNPVKDLTKEDFQIFEEGVEQLVTMFRIEALPGMVIPVPQKEGEANPSAPIVTTPARKVILFVDDYHLDFGNLVSIKMAGEKFIRNELLPTDLVALITSSGKHSTEFTKYREYVVSNLNSIMPWNQFNSGLRDCPPLTDFQAYQISQYQNWATTYDALEIAIADAVHCAALKGRPEGFPASVGIAEKMVLASARIRAAEIRNDSRRTLLSIKMLTRRLRLVGGQKILVLLSDGFISRDLSFEVHNAIDYAIRANTVIYSIDAKGLDATPSFGDASNPTPANPFTETKSDKARMDQDARNELENALIGMAHDTGGSFMNNSNDLLGQLKAAVDHSRVNYILGYYSSNPKRDGSFRKIAVRVKRPDVQVAARQGYYAPEGDANFTARKIEDVREALASGEDFKEIPVLLTFNIAQADPARPLVEIQTKVDVRKIAFQKKENRNRNIFTIVTVVYDSNNRYVDGAEKQIDFNLSDSSYKDVMKEGLRSQAPFRLSPGSYRVRTVVREAAEMKMGSATLTIEIVN